MAPNVTPVAPHGAPPDPRPQDWHRLDERDVPPGIARRTPRLVAYTRKARDGALLLVLVDREMFGVGDWRWHLSISTRTRNPTWEEISKARYDLIPDDVTMAMYLPRRADYVNMHTYCFHLTETHDAVPPSITRSAP